MNGSIHSPFLRLSTPAEEGTLRVSKWLKHQVLLDDQEMRELLKDLGEFFIFAASEVVTEKNALIEKEDFLQKYTSYVQALKNGELPNETILRRYFSSFFTTSKEILYAMEVGAQQYLVKALKPVLQLQVHHFFISSVDKKFHPMVLGKESVTWGIQFSYPQIYEHPKDHSYSKVVNSVEFPNTSLFTTLVKWLRSHTVATPFIFEEKRINVPIRIGKKCFSWIDSHPQLRAKGLKVFKLGGI